MAKILCPNKQYTGESAGVAFANGAGETTDPRRIAWFAAHGYTVVEPAPPEGDGGEGKPKTGPEGAGGEGGPETGKTDNRDGQPGPEGDGGEEKPETDKVTAPEGDGGQTEDVTAEALAKMTLEQLQAFAGARKMDLGNATSENGVRKKIEQALAGGAE